MKLFFLKFVVVVLSLIICQGMVISGEEEIQKQLDEFLQKWDRPDSPGFVFAVIHSGKFVYKKAVGMANLDYDIPVKLETVFDIGSISKQFTAACIAKLITEKKLSLEDDIRKYILEFPQTEDAVKIHHLIYQTSGIRDYTNMMIIAGKPFGIGYNEHNSLKWILRQNGLNFKPGEQFAYSNSNYFLLAYIVKKISGKSIGRYAKENLFDPLGMNQTFFFEDLKMIVKNRAIGYSLTGNEKYQQDHWFSTTFAGPSGVNITIDDLLLWDQKFYSDGELMELMHTKRPLNNNNKNDYAFGNFITDFRGFKAVWHSGERWRNANSVIGES